MLVQGIPQAVGEVGMEDPVAEAVVSQVVDHAEEPGVIPGLAAGMVEIPIELKQALDVILLYRTAHERH